MIAVTGASGHVGGRTAHHLAAAGVPTRLVVRDAAKAPRDLPLAEVAEVPGGYDDPDGLRAAFAGADTVFLVPAHEHPERVAQHVRAVDAAADAGVRRLVYLSFLGAAADATFTLARDHHATEEHVRARFPRHHTFLRMSLYADFLPMLVQDGAIRGPAGDGRFAPVLREDVARAAAGALRRDDHDGRTYALTGPALRTMQDVADELGVAYVDEPLDDAYASRAHLAEPWEVAGWVTSYQQIATGELELVTDDVARLSRPT